MSPILKIDEYAIILRVDDWFKPKTEPTIKVSVIIIDILNLINVSIIKGAILDKVNIKTIGLICNPSTTLNTQRWKGATPILIIIDSRIIES